MKEKIVFNNRFGTFKLNKNSMESDFFNITTFQLSVNQFPRFAVKIQLNSGTEFLNDLERGHQIIYSISIDGDNFIPRFVGEISSLEFTMKEDKSREINIKAESPFVRLQLTQLNQENLINIVGLREIMKTIMQTGRLWGSIIFDEDVDDDLEIADIYNYSAFSLLKQICLQRDLVFDIDQGHILRIANRITYERENFAKMKTFKESDMISLTIKK